MPADEHDADERHGQPQGADVARYEQLRLRALAGDPTGWRAGLAVLQHHGVAAWLRAWRALPTIASRPARPGPPAAATDHLVQALASMALGCLASGG